MLIKVSSSLAEKLLRWLTDSQISLQTKSFMESIYVLS